MKRFTILLLLLIAPHATQTILAQSESSVRYQGNALSIKGQKGFSLKVSNIYALEAGGFVPTFDTTQAEIDDKPFSISPNAAITALHTYLSGSFSPRTGFEFQFDYAGNKITLLNMLLSYKLSDRTKIQMGQMKVPGPMSRNYSFKTVMQSGTPMGLSMATGRRLGIGLFSNNGRYYAAAGAYTINLNNFVGIGLPKEPEVGVAGRLTYNVINKRHEKLLLGSNIYWMRMANGNSIQNGRIGVENSLTSARFIDYRYSNVNSQLNYGLEMAYQNRNFLMVIEGLGTNFFRKSDLHTPQYAGWNARLSYTLLGNPRGYNPGTGDFSGVPYDGKRALEVGINTSGIYLNDREDHNTVAGLSYSLFANYWTSDHLCLTLNAKYLDHHKDFHSNYSINNADNFGGIDFLCLMGRVTVFF